MTALPFKLHVDPTPMQFLFTVKGPLATKDLEGGRLAHNMAAGSDQGVAAARSFSDLSHAVYVPIKPNGSGAGELLIIDYWSNPAGIGTFFSDPQVQQGGSTVYRDREAVIWERTWAAAFQPAGAYGQERALRRHRARAGCLTREIREDPYRGAAETRQHLPRQGTDVARVVLPPRPTG